MTLTVRMGVTHDRTTKGRRVGRLEARRGRGRAAELPGEARWSAPRVASTKLRSVRAWLLALIAAGIAMAGFSLLSVSGAGLLLRVRDA